MGLYQWFATTAKKVGGPAKLIGMFISGGAIIGGAVGRGEKWGGHKGQTLWGTNKMNKLDLKVF